MNNDYSALANDIITYYKQRTEPCSSHPMLNDVLIRLLDPLPQEKTFTRAHLKQVNQAIQSIPTGRQRNLKKARDEALYYLQASCGWSLPKYKHKHFIDRDHRWFINLHKQSSIAQEIEKQYQTQTGYITKQTQSPSLAWIVMTLMIEVAPLPLIYWCERLNDPTPLDCHNNQIMIRIQHPKKLSYFNETEPQSFTQYMMTPMATRAFYMWQQSCQPKVTIEKLCDSLHQFFTQTISDRILSPNLWQTAIQQIWLQQYRLPPEILKDFSDPLRHVSALPRKHKLSGSQDIKNAHSPFNPYVESEFINESSSAAQSIDLYKNWPHRELIRNLDKGDSLGSVHQPDWNKNNLLPRFLFDYVFELIQYGGVAKSTLSLATIKRYTNFKQIFSNATLSLEIASNQTEFNEWAVKIYEQINSDTLDQWAMYQLLRFMTQFAITEHLDLSLFEKPTESIKIDALVLSADDVHELVNLLLSQAHSSLQSLFSAVSTLIAFYGKLRRGEVLRLRMQDVCCISPKGSSFKLEITNTTEGKTKNGQSRTVHITMPESAAKLIRLVIALKSSCASTTPFIGLSHESLAMRAHHYLLPTTRGLKYLFGKKARFHHLRHGGAKLLYQQSLVLANDHTPSSWCHLYQPITSYLLSKDTVKKQFNYWLNHRPFIDLNNMNLFDEMVKELGHSYYTTTRLHYLHGMEWVAPAFLPQDRTYTYTELRYILGMKPSSNDVARILESLNKNYATLPTVKKKSHLSTLSHEALNQELIKRLTLTDTLSSIPTKMPQIENENTLLTLWTQTLSALSNNKDPLAYHWETGSLIKNIRDGKIPFEQLANQWAHLGGFHGIKLNASQFAILKTLGNAKLDNQHTLSFCCPCNKKTEKALTILTEIGLRTSRHLTLYQNRKRLDSRKWVYLQNNLIRSKDKATKKVIATGKTHLKIEIYFTTLDDTSLQPFINWWNTIITINYLEEVL